MKRDDTVYLRHILDAIQKVEQYLNGVPEAIFIQDSLIQDGVIRQLEIMGEAVKRLSSSLREQNGQVPWADVAGMRDKLIHGYFGVDQEKVWLTAKDDLPVLNREIKVILADLTNPEDSAKPSSQ